MKLTKRIFALLICAAMLIPSCIIVNADVDDKATITLNETININEDVSYSKLTVKSGQNGNTVTGVSMEFDPKDGYFPMAFVKNAGSVGLLDKQYASATTKYGYDVIGAINGSFFGMDSGTLVGLLITNGKVSCAHAGYTDSVVAFGTDGSMNIVKSSLDYKLFINGQEIKNGLYYINKTHGKNGGWTNNFYYYDTSCGTITDTFDTNPGYTVICEKLDNTDLMVGSTLKGKVLEVKADSSYVRFEENDNIVSNRFALFVKTTSPNAAYVKDLKAGDSINISVNETVADSREIMENANSVITNVGWLVKDGEDRTRIDSTIGTHSVTLQARWTAFGTRPDGSYVFFTTEGGSTGAGGSVTLRDVADYMIEQGCTNVIRMDGGGSSAMYVKDTGNGNPGFVQSSSRSIADCILIVRNSSAVDETINAALQAKIDTAKASLEATPNDAISALVEEAEALLASDAPVSGDVRKMLADLSGALSGKDELSALVAQATGISYKDYSEVVLTQIRAAYDNAVYVLGANDSTIEQVENATAELKLLLALTGNTSLVVSTGKKYTTTKPNRNDVYDDDGSRLTDGSKGNADAGNSKYAGWNSKDKSKPNVVEVTIDLGEAIETNQYTVYMAGGNWGINLPKGCVSLQVYAGNDKDNLELVATAAEDDMVHTGGTEVDGSWSTYTITANGEKAVAAQFVKIVISHKAFGNGFIWIDEVEAGMSGDTVTDAIYVTGFNTSIVAGACNIFTPAISEDGTVTRENANHSWTTNVVLKKGENDGEYIVVSKSKGIGASTAPIKLEADQIMIAAHSWEGEGVDNPVVGSKANETLLGTAKVGDTLKFYGINVENCATGIAAYAKILGKTSTDPVDPNPPVDPEPPVDPDPKPPVNPDPVGDVVIEIDRVNNYDWTNKDFNSSEYVPTAASAGEILMATAVNGGETVADRIGGTWFQWWYKVLAEVTEDGNYKVIATDGSGSTDYEAWAIATNQFVILCNTGYASTEAAGNAQDATNLSSLAVGDILTLNADLADLQAQSGALTDVTVTKVVADDPVDPKPPVDSENESIDVDGDLSDNGWKEDGWVEVNPENGFWQTVPTTDTISYKYQFRTDDTKLYAAFIVDCAAVAGGNGSGTNVRFWINTDDEATVYTHFYDVFVGGTTAKYNTDKTANKSANIENSTLNAVLTTEGEKTYVEFSIDLAEFNGAEGFNYFICVSNKINENVCLYYPAVVEGDGRISNLPYNAWYTEGQGVADVEELKLGEIVPPVEPTVEEQMKEALGTAFDDAKFDFVIDAPESYKAGDEITVTVTVNNVTAANGVHIVEFKLYYDNEKLVLTNGIDEADDNTLTCIKTLPEGWENLSFVNNDFVIGGEATEVKPLNDGVITAIALTTSIDEADAITEDGQLVFEFTFKVLEDAEGDLGFVIPHAETDGAFNSKDDIEKFNANGDYAIVTEAELFMVGDVNGDNKIDKYDYLLIKRHVMGTLVLGADVLDVANVNKDDKVDKYDYLLIKRHVMGTYVIEG